MLSDHDGGGNANGGGGASGGGSAAHFVHDAGDARSANFDAFLETLPEREKTKLQRHIDDCDGEASREHVELWKRMLFLLHRLAGHAIQSTGQRAVQFYVADGAYRMQAFALEDPRDHTLAIYTTDVLARALESGILAAPTTDDADAAGGGPDLYGIVGERSARLRIEQLTDAASHGPDYYRHMVGWNRKAMKITLPVSAGPAMVRAIESLCALAALPATPKTAR